MDTCDTCKFFKSGATDGLMHRHLIVLDGRSPSTQDILGYRLHNKDGQCQFMPQAQQKNNDDSCGQWKDAMNR